MKCPNCEHETTADDNSPQEVRCYRCQKVLREALVEAKVRKYGLMAASFGSGVIFTALVMWFTLHDPDAPLVKAKLAAKLAIGPFAEKFFNELKYPRIPEDRIIGDVFEKDGKIMCMLRTYEPIGIDDKPWEHVVQFDGQKWRCVKTYSRYP